MPAFSLPGPPAVLTVCLHRQLEEGLAAIAAHPNDAYAHDTVGIARFRLAEGAIAANQGFLGQVNLPRVSRFLSRGQMA